MPTLIKLGARFECHSGIYPPSSASEKLDLSAEKATIGITNLSKSGEWQLHCIHLKPVFKPGREDAARLRLNDIIIPTSGALLREDEARFAFHVDPNLLNQFEPEEAIYADRLLLILRPHEQRSSLSEEAIQLATALTCEYLNVSSIRKSILQKCVKGTVQPVLSKRDLLQLSIPDFFYGLNDEKRNRCTQLFQEKRATEKLSAKIQTELETLIPNLF